MECRSASADSEPKSPRRSRVSRLKGWSCTRLVLDASHAGRWLTPPRTFIGIRRRLGSRDGVPSSRGSDGGPGIWCSKTPDGLVGGPAGRYSSLRPTAATSSPTSVWKPCAGPAVPECRLFLKVPTVISGIFGALTKPKHVHAARAFGSIRTARWSSGSKRNIGLPIGSGFPRNGRDVRSSPTVSSIRRLLSSSSRSTSSAIARPTPHHRVPMAR